MMGNMSYCRFENTSNDLRDCVNAWDDEVAEGRRGEIRAKARILKMAGEILQAEGVYYDEDDFEAAIERIKSDLG